MNSQNRTKIAAAGLCLTALASAQPLAAETVRELAPLTVVSSGLRSENPFDLGVTLVPLTKEQLNTSTAVSVTDMLSQNTIGYFSQWTPAQTSIVLRGATSNAQGREDGSQVAVLINGRRTGTSNISKLSTSLAHQIEILKGPSSVLYGNNAMGGVVNIITPTGLTAPGYHGRVTYGSWDFREGILSAGGSQDGFDYWIGLQGAKQNDYESGRGSVEKPLGNTAFERAGGLVNLGYTFDSGVRVGLLYLNDGTYNAGFRGSSFNTFNYDNRTNESFELSIDNFAANSDVNFQAQVFWVEDQDHFYWGNQIVGTIARDNNFRDNNLLGLKASLDFKPWQGATLMLGTDVTHGELRSTRTQLTNAGVFNPTVRPQDVNADSLNAAVFTELRQELLDERLLLRAGLRYDYFRDKVVNTGGYPASLGDNKFDYDSLIYNLNAVYRVTETMNLRAGVATGFSRPTPTARVGNFLSNAGNPVIPNPDLKPETSLGFELGARFNNGLIDSDFALFSTRIDNALETNRWEVPGSAFTDNIDDRLIQGFEWRNSIDIANLLNQPDFIFEIFGNLNHNFTLKNNDAGFQNNYNSDKAWRTYETQANFGFVVGQPKKWDFRWNTVYNGDFWWFTEERLAGVPRQVNKYPSFFNTFIQARYFFKEDAYIFAGVNNLFDVNASSVFLARNEEPLLSDPAGRNGGVGNSNPGRQFVVGLDWRF